LLKNKKMKGFTLLECLVALAVFSCVCNLFSLCIRQADKSSKQVLQKEEKLWQVFLIQLENEVSGLTLQQVEATEMVFLKKSNNHTVIIQFKNGKIIKRDNGGYQPLLIGLNSAQFKKEKHAVELVAQFHNQTSFQGRWVIPVEEPNE
jgi:competence protein ComGF